MIKRIIISLIILSFPLLTINKDSNNLEVYFFDVGQGDSTLIRANDFNILIDGGPDGSVLRKLSESLPSFAKKIDLIILSHYHDDHISGLIEVIKRYEVQRVIYLEDSPSSLVFERFMQTIENSKSEAVALETEMKIDLGKDCAMELWAPTIFLTLKNNNNSIIAKLDCYQKKFLFSGDNEDRVEKALLSSGLDLDVDVFKASHHGSKTSNGSDFLRMISPNQVIISVGADNTFGHPNGDVLERLDGLDIVVYRTDIQGTIKIVK